MPRMIVLLRGINVGGHKRIGMADLREACVRAGFADAETYLQSGNLLISPADDAGPRLERVIEDRFGHRVDVIVRSAQRWAGYVAGNVFPDVAAREPNRLMLFVPKGRPRAGAVDALRERATGEMIAANGDAICIHFPSGLGQSKLGPGLVDRLVGVPMTARNWNTVLALHRLAGAGQVRMP